MDRRKQSAPRKALDTHLGEAGKRRGELHKSMTNYFRSAEFNRKRLAIEEQAEGFKQHPQPEPPVSGGASSAPEHVHEPAVKFKRIAQRKAKIDTELSERPKKKKVVQGTVVPKRRGTRAVQGRPVGRLPSEYRGMTPRVNLSAHK